MKDELPITTKIYLRAAELIEQGHCKGCFAKDKHGNVVFISDPGLRKAVSFCYYGARIRAADEFASIKDRNAAISEFQEFMLTPNSLSIWNDHPDTTAAMVAAKLREQAFGD